MDGITLSRNDIPDTTTLCAYCLAPATHYVKLRIKATWQAIPCKLEVYACDSKKCQAFVWEKFVEHLTDFKSMWLKRAG